MCLILALVIKVHLKSCQFVSSATSCDPVTTAVSTSEPTTPCLTYTTGGNGGGAFCKFPFIYKGRTYYECTIADNPKLWCATTDNYDIDELWGRCAGNITEITKKAQKKMKMDWV